MYVTFTNWKEYNYNVNYNSQLIKNTEKNQIK